MPRFPKSLATFRSPSFKTEFTNEIQQLGIDGLPLQQALTSSSVALDDKLEVLILKSSETAQTIVIKAGLFYSGIIAGCSCADDPTPLDEQTEYGELLFSIDKSTAEVTVQLV